MLLFNRYEAVTYRQVMEELGDQCDVHILSLAHPKFAVLAKSPNTPKLSETDEFCINSAFTSKVLKIKIPLIKTSSAAAEEENAQAQQVESARHYQIDASIVRIMKIRKSLSHQNLISETVKSLSSRFTPEVFSVKRRIEALIEQEFLERDSADHALYHYVA